VSEITDTIAAIATAPGESAISIVRVSGPKSLAIADRIFRCRGPRPSERRGNTFAHGRIVSIGAGPGVTSERIVDEVILLIYRTPSSYTREDAIEIQGHGGVASARRILRAVLDSGARSAEPGEFTKRAFLNGRIDLIQAEAVLDVIRAASDRAANAAIEQLNGHLSRSFKDSYDELLTVAADLEATLDFMEGELPSSTFADIAQRLRTSSAHLEELLDTWDEGHLLREGALVVISGKPNVGKSTLLNALLGRDRAIVTHIPGTTRDIIEESMLLDGFPIRLVDTAGLRETQCDIESEGVRRAKAFMSKADIHLHVIDASAHIDEVDLKSLAGLAPAKSIVILNKADLGVRTTAQDVLGLSSVRCSLQSGSGPNEILSMLIDKLIYTPLVHPRAVISERHRRIVVSTVEDLSEAISLLSVGQEEPSLSASRLRSALESLGEATGRVYHDDILNSIFSRFCIGK
jgi:tRNA modification GTPase